MPSSGQKAKLFELLELAVEMDEVSRASWLADLRSREPALADDLERYLGVSESPLLERGLGSVIASDLAEPDGFASTDDDRIGTRVGNFEVTSVLGSGGMGAVYLGRRVDGEVNQTVAIKVLRESFATSTMRARFALEREVLAQLSHPNIARLLDAGTTQDGAPYFTMEYVQGRPISSYCFENVPSVEGRLTIALQAARAIGFAHHNLIIHRDIKPSNILVTGSGSVKLLDFGIAKLVSAEPSGGLTRSNVGPMTPEYAAPEQFRVGPITVSTDVYQFGVLLFVILTGRLPYRADPADTVEWARSVTVEPAISLSRAFNRRSAEDVCKAWPGEDIAKHVVRRLTGDVDAIIQKALEKNPAERYQSMDALCDDIESFLAGRVVRARTPTAWYRTSRFIGRHRLAAGLSAAAVAALAVTTAVAVHQASVARSETVVARANEQSAQAAQTFMENVFLQADPWKNDGAPPDALELADVAFESVDEDLRDQPLARADMYWSLARMYQVAGSRERAVLASQRAVDIYRTIAAEHKRTFDGLIRLAASQTYVGDLAAAERTIHEAARLPDLTDYEASRVQSALAFLFRDRGRYDLSRRAQERAIVLNAQSPFSGDFTALSQLARMSRSYSDAARHLLFADAIGTYSASRGARAYMAMHELLLLPQTHRTSGDLALAHELEAERAAVWPDGTWKLQFKSLLAQLQLQRGDRGAAVFAARSMPLTGNENSIDVGGYDAEFWLHLTYLLLAEGERSIASGQFGILIGALQRYSDPEDPRMLLAAVGKACADGELSARLLDSLKSPPQPEYWGYAWLREVPCEQLRGTTAALHPDSQPFAFGDELRQALEEKRIRLGECNDGVRVGVGQTCD